MKFFLPPLFSILFFMSLLSIYGAFIDSGNVELATAILGILFFSIICYPFILIIHLFGCLFIQLLKTQKLYTKKSILCYGFLFGSVLCCFLFSDAQLSTVGVVMIGGMAGMCDGWFYFQCEKWALQAEEMVTKALVNDSTATRP